MAGRRPEADDRLHDAGRPHQDERDGGGRLHGGRLARLPGGDHDRQGEGRRCHREHQCADPQAPAQRDEAVAKEEQGVARGHEEDEGQVADRDTQLITGQRVHLADDAGQAERGQRQCQVATARLAMPQPVHHGGHAQCQEAEADDSLDDLERPAHQTQLYAHFVTESHT